MGQSSKERDAGRILQAWRVEGAKPVEAWRLVDPSFSQVMDALRKMDGRHYLSLTVGEDVLDIELATERGLYVVTITEFAEGEALAGHWLLPPPGRFRQHPEEVELALVEQALEVFYVRGERCAELRWEQR